MKHMNICLRSVNSLKSGTDLSCFDFPFNRQHLFEIQVVTLGSVRMLGWFSYQEMCE